MTVNILILCLSSVDNFNEKILTFINFRTRFEEKIRIKNRKMMFFLNIYYVVKKNYIKTLLVENFRFCFCIFYFVLTMLNPTTDVCTSEFL